MTDPQASNPFTHEIKTMWEPEFWTVSLILRVTTCLFPQWEIQVTFPTVTALCSLVSALRIWKLCIQNSLSSSFWHFLKGYTKLSEIFNIFSSVVLSTSWFWATWEGSTLQKQAWWTDRESESKLPCESNLLSPRDNHRTLLNTWNFLAVLYARNYIPCICVRCGPHPPQVPSGEIQWWQFRYHNLRN